MPIFDKHSWTIRHWLRNTPEGEQFVMLSRAARSLLEWRIVVRVSCAALGLASGVYAWQHDGRWRVTLGLSIALLITSAVLTRVKRRMDRKITRLLAKEPD